MRHLLHSKKHQLKVCILIVWAIGFGVSSLTLASDKGHAQSPPQQTVLIMGDSISAAFGMDKSLGWVALMQDTLGDSVQVINASISGETTSGGRHRIQQALQQHQPDLVILELGGNDGLRGTPIPHIQNNLLLIAQSSQKAGADVLILGIRIPPNYGARYIEQFFQVFNTVADKTNSDYVPFFLEGIAGTAGMMQADGIHPSQAAQPLMAERVGSKVRAWQEALHHLRP